MGSKIKDEAYITNLDESIGTHQIALYVHGINVTYFDRFGVEHIPKKKMRKFIGSKNIITNICRVQAYDSVISRYFSIGFID